MKSGQQKMVDVFKRAKPEGNYFKKVKITHKSSGENKAQRSRPAS